MAVRLQLKLGAVTEGDRLPDSPDTTVVVEPSVGAVGRTKGQLYLLVTCRIPGGRAREATRVVADTIRNEYYYDESAGIRSCLVKALSLANKRLAHQRDRYGLGHGADGGGGPIGVAVAVVRGRELYCATVGPAQAYLIRQARLSTLPDPYGERGLPTGELNPEVWRGELSVGDSLCLVSANLVRAVGTDALKDALVTLHPQSAIEHLHAQFVAADGQGSDGAVAFEATEVGATQRTRTLVPVRAPEPLAGTADRSPIPLADSVTAGAAAIGAGATRARGAAGLGLHRLLVGLQDLLPARRRAAARVTAAPSRLETQRRAAVALLALVVVAAGLGIGVYALGGQARPPADAARSMTVAQRAFEAASAAVAQVTGPGIDLVTNDPGRARSLLSTAYAELDKAQQGGYPASEVARLRRTVAAGLDTLYKVVPVRSTTLYTFPAGATPTRLTGIVRGSDGAPYVLDAGGKTVWRIDRAKRTAAAVVKSGQRASGSRVADPRFLTTGGPDILVLDVKNVLWRWRPVDDKGKGTLVRIRVVDAASWGDDVRGISTFVANFDAAFYKLYVVDPSEQNIMVLSPASDGTGYPQAAVRRLPADRPVDGITDLLIDGDIYVAENGAVARLIPARGWEPRLPGDVDLRPAPRFTLIASASDRGTGVIYAFDAANRRLIAFNKSDGAFVEQYRLAGDDPGWGGLRDLTILPPATTGAPATAWWISDDAVHSVPLEAVPDGAAPSGSASASATPSGGLGSPSASPSASRPRATAKPTRKP